MSEPFDPRDDDRVLDMLGGALPRVAPEPELFSRILAAVAEETPAQAPVRARAWPRWRPHALLLTAPVLGAAVAAVVTLVLSSGGGLGKPEAVAPVASHLASAHVVGTADLYRSDVPGGKLSVRLSDVPAPPRDTHYEVWVLRRGSTEMTAVGSFTPAGTKVHLVLPLPAPGAYAAMDISVQRNDGPPQHSQTSLAGATF
jgi:anti-sigma-K factor RskA